MHHESGTDVRLFSCAQKEANMSRKIIDFVERNIHGAWAVWGDLGIRQYYGYTKKESMKKYRQEWLETVAPFICQKVK